jgi:hypothetical protein
MVHRVALVRTDVSEELNASIIRVTRIDELATTLAVRVILIMVALSSSETSVLKRATRPNIPEDILRSHRSENFNPYDTIYG